jgi:hypothetical protein
LPIVIAKDLRRSNARLKSRLTKQEEKMHIRMTDNISAATDKSGRFCRRYLKGKNYTVDEPTAKNLVSLEVAEIVKVKKPKKETEETGETELLDGVKGNKGPSNNKKGKGPKNNK